VASEGYFRECWQDYGGRSCRHHSDHKNNGIIGMCTLDDDSALMIFFLVTNDISSPKLLLVLVVLVLPLWYPLCSDRQKILHADILLPPLDSVWAELGSIRPSSESTLLSDR